MVPTPPMVLTELSLRGARESLHWPLERLTEHFGLLRFKRRAVTACGDQRRWFRSKSSDSAAASWVTRSRKPVPRSSS